MWSFSLVASIPIVFIAEALDCIEEALWVSRQAQNRTLGHVGHTHVIKTFSSRLSNFLRNTTSLKFVSVFDVHV